MAIHRTGGFKKGGQNRKMKCWDCGKPAPAFMYPPARRVPICKDCAGSKWAGIEIEDENGEGEAPSTD